jgi:hypothetical protein
MAKNLMAVWPKLTVQERKEVVVAARREGHLKKPSPKHATKFFSCPVTLSYAHSVGTRLLAIKQSATHSVNSKASRTTVEVASRCALHAQRAQYRFQALAPATLFQTLHLAVTDTREFAQLAETEIALGPRTLDRIAHIGVRMSVCADVDGHALRHYTLVEGLLEVLEVLGVAFLCRR